MAQNSNTTSQNDQKIQNHSHPYLLTTLQGHSSRCWSIAFDPHLPLIASSSADKTIRTLTYRPVQKGGGGGGLELQFQLDGVITTNHTRTVRSVSFSPKAYLEEEEEEEGKDEVKEDEEDLDIDHESTTDETISNVTSKLAAASFDSTISIWERRWKMGNDDDSSSNGNGTEEVEWEQAGELDGQENECKCVRWSRDGALIASCSRDKSVWIWEVLPDAEFEVLAVLMDHDQDVKAIAWHPKEEMLVSGSYDSSMIFYSESPSDGEWFPHQTISSAHPSPGTVWSLSFCPYSDSTKGGGGGWLVSAGDGEDEDEIGKESGGQLRIWRREKENFKKKATTGSSGDIRTIGKGQKERWNLVKVLNLYDEVDIDHAMTEEGVGLGPILSVEWGEGGIDPKESGGLGRIIAAGGDGRIRIWQISLATSDSSSSDDDDPTIELTANLLTTMDRSHGESEVNCVAWCSYRPERHRGRRRRRRPNRAAEVENEKWKGIEDIFATAGDDGTVKMWQLRAGDVDQLHAASSEP